MLRRIALAIVVAVALAGVMLFPSSAQADTPLYLVCEFGNGRTVPTFDFITIDSFGGVSEAVAYCLSLEGHPAGVVHGKKM